MESYVLILLYCRYVKPRQVTVPEFLEEVTTSDGAMFLQPGFPILDIEGFVEAYKKSDQYKDVCRVVNNPEVVEDFWVEVKYTFSKHFCNDLPSIGAVACEYS